MLASREAGVNQRNIIGLLDWVAGVVTTMLRILTHDSEKAASDSGRQPEAAFSESCVRMRSMVVTTPATQSSNPMIFRWFTPASREASIASLYGAIVAQARRPAFYQIYRVP